MSALRCARGDCADICGGACSKTAIFAQGVGLGASKGAEVGKYAEGYAGYVQKAQDAVSGLEIVQMATKERAFTDRVRCLPGEGAVRQLKGERSFDWYLYAAMVILVSLSCLNIVSCFRARNIISSDTLS